MKDFLQKVCLRLSMVLMAVLCSAALSYGQEDTTIKHKVYTNVYGDATINCPNEVADGDTLFFSVEKSSQEVITYSLQAFCEDKWFPSKEIGHNENDHNQRYIANVTGDVLIHCEVAENKTVNGETYAVFPSSSQGSLISVQSAPASVELKNVIEVDGRKYSINDYHRVFYNEYSNVQSITLPNSPFNISGSLGTLEGLTDLYAKAIDPKVYSNFSQVFGEKDLSGVTLHVPAGCTSTYEALGLGFKEIVEEPLPEKYAIHVLGEGIASYTAKLALFGESGGSIIEVQDSFPRLTEGMAGDIDVEVTLESGYVTEAIYYTSVQNEDYILRIGTSKLHTEGDFTYGLTSGSPTTMLHKINGTLTEFTVPAFATIGSNTYLINVGKKLFEGQTSLEKVTFEGDFVEISDSAFWGCTGLKEIHCKSATPPSLTRRSFNGIDKAACVVYVPTGAVDTYRADTKWNEFATILEEGSEVTYSLIYDLANITVTPQIESVKRDSTLTLTLKADSGYFLPDTISVMTESGAAVTYTYEKESGVLTVPSVQSALKISAAAKAPVYHQVLYSFTHISLANQIDSIAQDSTLSVVLKADSGYYLPDTIGIVTVQEQLPVTHTYDTITGLLTVPSVQASLKIWADAIKIPDTTTIAVQDTVLTDVTVDNIEIVAGETSSNDTVNVKISGVTTSELSVEDGANATLELTGENDLGTVTNNGTLIFASAGEGTQLIAELQNEGTLIDNTGLVTNVGGTGTLSIEPLGNKQAGSTVTLTAIANPSEFFSSLTFEWQSLTEDGFWTVLNTSVYNAATTLMTKAVETKEVIDTYEATVTETTTYRCVITSVVKNGDKEVATTLVTKTEVEYVAVTGISLDKTTLRLEVNGTAQLTATVSPENATDKTVTWSSSNEAVATVDTNGKVTAVSVGTAIITVKVGDKTATCEVTVIEPEPEPVVTYGVVMPVVEGVTTNPGAGTYEVEEGDYFSFTLKLDEDYSDSDPVVIVNGKEITPTVNGVYVIYDITSNLTITIVGIEPNSPTANAEVKADAVKVWGTNGNLHIQTATPQTAYIVTFSGQIYRIINLPGGDYETTLPKGAYIIRIGEQTFKVQM